MAQSSYQLINLTSNIVLTWPFSFTGGNTVADINDINPDQDDWTIAMPDATLASNGQYVIFNNISAFDVIILDNSLAPITTLDAGDVKELYLYNTSTPEGLWRVIPYGSVTNAITAVSLRE